ncbi:MAG: YkgJ family cysteine cluster protein [Nitrososphaerota archaeon]|jgi:Fe-S-cluster containining protein|nr:YkgJ family cysteine cluster protein [Nitrososphaerota archaeon]
MLETYYVHLEFQAKMGVWSVNLPFLCCRCGVCCTLDDFLTAGEICASREANSEVFDRFRALTEELGVLFEKGEDTYDSYVTSVKCPFQVGCICSIYDIRPLGCRQFPNTPFGMLSTDCQALDRFKRQCLALKRGWLSVKETGYFTSDSLKSTQFSEKQYITCIDKLRRAGATEDEITLFSAINKPASL